MMVKTMKSVLFLDFSCSAGVWFGFFGKYCSAESKTLHRNSHDSMMAAK